MNWQAKLGIIALPLVAITLWYLFSPEEQRAVNEPERALVKIFAYDPARDQGPGGPECTEAGLVPLSRSLTATQSPIEDTLQLLLHDELTRAERMQGLTSEFPLDSVVLESVALSNGTLTLTFSDPQYATSGGACRAAILRAQIEATAKQFNEVTSVEFLPQEVFQP